MQVYDTPIGFMNKMVAKGICSSIGEVCPSEFSIMEGGDHVCVRVILDISKPLCCERKITLKGGTMGWVSFKYERLPSICFWCGYLTHREKDCEQWITSEGSLTVEDRKYKAWLRAPLSNQIRKSTIAVLGFYQQKKYSKVSKGEGREPSLKPHQTSSSKSGNLMKPLDKVIPISVPPNISNSTTYPSDRDLEDLPPGFGGQANTKSNFSHAFYEFDAELGKGDVMEDRDGKLEMLPRKGSATSEKPRDEGSKVKSPT